MSLPVILLISFGLTLAVELPLLFAFGFRRTDMLLGFLANLLTNPPLVFTYHVLKAYTSLPPFLALIALEALAFFVEGLVFRFGTEKKHPFLISLAVNGISFAAGLAISKTIQEVIYHVVS